MHGPYSFAYFLVLCNCPVKEHITKWFLIQKEPYQMNFGIFDALRCKIDNLDFFFKSFYK